VKKALADGYSNAFSAIFDSNLTSIITGPLIFTHEVFVNQTSHEHSCKEGYKDTDNQCRSKTTIYERTKEELRAGKGVKKALADGYSNAFSAIFDSTFIDKYVRIHCHTQ